ncbi:MAG: EamA-like transporter family protein [Candidatus Methanofastidiosum methylothiophilum]|uniref:EamA-like transporter family protein n=1 Tax=Candidatus Methanofastidiosum methylothiophilum TaxID=1705564 RepID=A0A150IQX4_9EURY|nr:MAG: EamA-like transporter family protein [Candidatus Methanofastidiosum methylthiophilus]KYC47397.1 MAG: EamA-like transporter family protein [Candidatus Methanofastidiosum methylthiophilus]KYC49285.1 MAG: EamA-like transporter family protein [Candidatus Methanofastidiosum methylthiophilus]
MKAEGIAVLSISSALYGFSIILVKMALNQGYSSYSLVSSRSLLSIPLMALAIFFLKDKVNYERPLPKRDLILIGIIGSGTAMMTLYLGQAYTLAINAGFIFRFVFIFTALFSHFLLKDKIHRGQYASMIIMFIGMYFISTDGKALNPQWGDILVLLASLQVGFTNVLAKITMKKVNSYMISAIRIFIGSVFIVLVVSALFGTGTLSPISSIPFTIVALALLEIIFIFLYYRGIEIEGPLTATLFFLMGALVSAILSYVILGETLSVIGWAGGVLIMVGAYILIKKSK